MQQSTVLSAPARVRRGAELLLDATRERAKNWRCEVCDHSSFDFYLFSLLLLPIAVIVDEVGYHELIRMLPELM